jgi:ABC-type glycerol-3-phosphate transport system substrate-binding protein
MSDRLFSSKTCQEAACQSLDWRWLIVLAALASLSCDRRQDDANEIQVWCYSGSGGPSRTQVLWQSLADRFQKVQPGIKIRVSADIPHSQYMAVLGSRFIGKNAPDVMVADDGDMVELATEGLLEPLDDLILACSADGKHHFLPSRLADGRVDGKSMSLPWTGSWVHLLYRSDILTAIHATPPASWEELRQLCFRLQREKQITYPLAFDPRSSFVIINFIWQNDASPLSSDCRTVTLSTPKLIAALQFVHDLIFKDKVIDPTLVAGTNAQDLWSSGSAVLLLDGGWMVTQYDQTYPKWADRWEIAPLPSGKLPTSFFGGTQIGISVTSTHKAAAKAFLRFATSSENQMLLTQCTGSPPNDMNAFGSAEFAAKYPHMLRMRDAVRNSRNTPLIGFFSLLWYDQFKNNVLDKIMADPNADIAAVVRQAEPAMQTLVDDYWVRHPSNP